MPQDDEWEFTRPDVVERRQLVVDQVGVGWSESAGLPKARYRVVERDDEWAVFTFDEQQAGWDREHGVH